MEAVGEGTGSPLELWDDSPAPMAPPAGVEEDPGFTSRRRLDFGFWGPVVVSCFCL